MASLVQLAHLDRTTAVQVCGLFLRRAFSEIGDDSAISDKCSDVLAFAADTVEKCWQGYHSPACAIEWLDTQIGLLRPDAGSPSILTTRDALIAIRATLTESN